MDTTFIQVIFGLIAIAIRHWYYLAGAGVAILIVRAVFYSQVWQKPKRAMWLKFAVIYRKKPMRRYSWPKIGAIMQEHIDRVLEQLAYNYLRACADEQQLSAEYPTNATNRNVHVDMREMRRLSSRVYITKHAFWQAHQVAKTYGYAVKRQAKEYCRMQIFNDTKEAMVPTYVSLPA